MSYFFKNPLITFFGFILLALTSIWALFNTPVDALPDLSENQVIVMTPWNGQNPQNIEDQVTYPITVAMQSLAGVQTVRGMSQMGVSMVTVIFEDSTDFYFARSQVFEKLSQIQNQIPEGVTPVLGPDATGLGHVFMYHLESDIHSLSELRTMQDYIVAYDLQSVSGVSEIAPIGGEVKVYKVLLDPYKMEEFHISLTSVMQTLKNANNNVSGKVLSVGAKEIAVQGIGFFETLEDIRDIPLTNSKGEPILLSYISTVVEDSQFRRSILAGVDKETVGAIVVMRQGENPLEVIKNVKEKIIEIETRLPEGVKITAFYDRTDLIQGAITTLRNVLGLELLITIMVLGLFLWHVRSSFMVAISLVISVLLTFLLMYLFKIPFNIMSLGGIAIAIGTMVDAIVVITEDVYSRMVNRVGYSDRCTLQNIISDSLKTVAKPLTFAIFIIILSFIPILGLEGMEGKLFHPLAWTNIFAMISALFVALFFVPAFCIWGIKGKLYKDEDIPINRFFTRIYKPFLQKALQYKKITLLFTFGIFAIAAVLFPRIDSEFMPELDEGALMYMPITFPDISDAKASEWLIETNKILSTIPEVEQVVGKAGRANTATDPAPLSMFETFVTLKPKSEWEKGRTKKNIVQDIYKKIRIEGLENGVTQPIIGRIGMMSTGIRSQIGIKIYGEDPVILEELAIKTSNMLGENIAGTYGNAAVKTMGLEYLNIDIDENKLSEYGVSKQEVMNIISAGIGGMKTTTIFDGREGIGLEVQITNDKRDSVEDIRNLWVHQKDVTTVRLKDISTITLDEGPAVIRSENGRMYATIQTDVQGLGLVDYVDQAKAYLENNLVLPQGYYIEWTGQYKNQIRAKERLTLIVPATIVLIFFLLLFTYKNLRLVSIVMIAIPLGITGGIISLYFADYNFSVAVWIGFIALFGNVVETGMVMVMYLKEGIDDYIKHNGKALIPLEIYTQITIESATKRLRPILMTAFTSVLGLLPLLFTTGIGSEVQKPLAIVVTGGLTTALFLTLVVIPLLFVMVREKK